jgi:hypothetical protein
MNEWTRRRSVISEYGFEYLAAVIMMNSVSCLKLHTVRRKRRFEGTYRIFWNVGISQNYTALERGRPLLFILKQFLGVEWNWVHLVHRPLFGLLYQPRIMDDDECGWISGMRIGRGNRSARRKPAPVPLYPPQIPHYLSRARNQAVGMGSQRLTASDMARPTL